MRRAAKAPVASCWLETAAAEDVALAAAEAEEAPEEAPVPAAELADEGLLLEVVMVAAARDELAETRAAVAFLVPHCSLLLQVV